MDLPLHPDCSLLASHPCGLLGVEKAAGVLSHPNREADRPRSLLPLPYDPEREAFHDGDRFWYLLNRLDGPTSGVLLLATDPEVATRAREAFAAHQVEKTYAAVVKGVPARKTDRWADCLGVRREKGQLRTRVLRGRPNAITRVVYRPGSAGHPRRRSGSPARSFLELMPLTGLTHQLRVQCAARRLPILGDATYGDFRFNREMRQAGVARRLYLHSWKTRIRLEVAGRACELAVESPVPACFTVALS